uniref:Uncharacterized protein n=1 Tax=Ascaris lumbricoides TaxID=6252 RepID=A0A0M3HZI4_ASCLU
MKRRSIAMLCLNYENCACEQIPHYHRGNNYMQMCAVNHEWTEDALSEKYIHRSCNETLF